MENIPKYDVGKTYLFRDGKIDVLDLTISKTELDNFIDSGQPIYKYGLNSDEERISVGDSSNYLASESNVIRIYQKYVDEGYSIIRDGVMLNTTSDNRIVSLETRTVRCIVAENITQKDRENIDEVFSSLELNKDYSSIINYKYDNIGISIDQYTQSQYNNATLGLVLNYFLKEKTNDLSSEEQEMFDKYRAFNLEELLTINNTHYAINNCNSGVIVITGSDTYARTLKTSQHVTDIKSIYNTIRPNFNSDELGFPALVHQTSDVIMQLNFGTIIIWIPSAMTEYQKNEVQKIANKVMEINTNKEILDKEKVLVLSGQVNGTTSTLVDDFGETVEDLVDYLDNLNNNKKR